MSGRNAIASPVGSDFESLPASMLKADQVPPWERDGEKTRYVETGRQALSVTAAVLSSMGFNELLVPGYLCTSMVEPFFRAGWRVRSLGITPDLRLPPDAADEIGAQPQKTALLLASYFGRMPDENHLMVASEARARGSIVIEDETHRVFRPGSGAADVRFASLRKLLPVADGAYIQGRFDVLAAAEALRASDSQRWNAMDEKATTFGSSEAIDFQSTFARENARLEGEDRRRLATSRSVDTVRSLPYESMSNARKANAALLRDLLSRIGVSALPVDSEEVPSHLVVRVADPTMLQMRLASQRVYCAIHWPRVNGVDGIATWCSDLLSLPIDHRYGFADMHRIAALIEQDLSK